MNPHSSGLGMMGALLAVAALDSNRVETGGRPKRQAHFLPIGPRVKIGRNDACYCGSGKKFKRCHRRNG